MLYLRFLLGKTTFDENHNLTTCFDLRSHLAEKEPAWKTLLKNGYRNHVDNCCKNNDAWNFSCGTVGDPRGEIYTIKRWEVFYDSLKKKFNGVRERFQFGGWR